MRSKGFVVVGALVFAAAGAFVAFGGLRGGGDVKRSDAQVGASDAKLIAKVEPLASVGTIAGADAAGPGSPPSGDLKEAARASALMERDLPQFGARGAILRVEIAAAGTYVVSATSADRAGGVRLVVADAALSALAKADGAPKAEAVVTVAAEPLTIVAVDLSRAGTDRRFPPTSVDVVVSAAP